MSAITRLGVSGFPRSAQTFAPKSFIRCDGFTWNEELQAWMIVGLNIRDLIAAGSELDVLKLVGSDLVLRGVVVISDTQPATSDGRLWWDLDAEGTPGASLRDIRTITTDTTITTSMADLMANAVDNPITATLPPVAANVRRIYLLKKVDSSANLVTLDGNGALIDDEPTRPLRTKDAGIEVISDATQWRIR